MGFQHGFRQVFRKYLISRTQDDCALDRVFEFTDVAWPVIADQKLLCFRGDSHNFAVALVGILCCEIDCQHGNIVLTVAEGGHVKLDDV